MLVIISYKSMINSNIICSLQHEFQKLSILKNTNNTPNYFILLVSKKKYQAHYSM